MATVTLVGSGGVEFVFDTPLREVYIDQVARGLLTPKSERDRRRLAPPEPTGTTEAPREAEATNPDDTEST